MMLLILPKNKRNALRILSWWLFLNKCDVFFKSPNLKKEIFQKTILYLKFKFSANNSKVLLAENLNFKLRIVFWNIFFWRFGDLKNT